MSYKRYRGIKKTFLNLISIYCALRKSKINIKRVQKKTIKSAKQISFMCFCVFCRFRALKYSYMLQSLLIKYNKRNVKITVNYCLKVFVTQLLKFRHFCKKFFIVTYDIL